MPVSIAERPWSVCDLRNNLRFSVTTHDACCLHAYTQDRHALDEMLRDTGDSIAAALAQRATSHARLKFSAAATTTSEPAPKSYMLEALSTPRSCFVDSDTSSGSSEQFNLPHLAAPREATPEHYEVHRQFPPQASVPPAQLPTAAAPLLPRPPTSWISTPGLLTGHCSHDAASR